MERASKNDVIAEEKYIIFLREIAEATDSAINPIDPESDDGSVLIGEKGMALG